MKMTAPQTAYLQFKASDAGPFQTLKVAMREVPTPTRGQTKTGYGKRLPTTKQVLWAGRWRAVRVACWSNSGTAYIGKPGAWIATVQEV